MYQESPDPNITERESFGDLLSRLATASAALVRDEIELVKQEAHEKIKSIQTVAIMMAVAALFGVVALLALCAALVIGIGALIGAGWAALAVGAGAAIVSGAIAGVAIARFKKTGLKPQATIHSLKESREWIKKGMR